mgnify:FL=1|tara:strand:+ start:898 stop:1188 length:291 start_codon:yes stop_codon:yes gene_type:complete
MLRRNNDNKMVEEIKNAEYLAEICKMTPQINIGTQCGVGKYRFHSIGYNSSNELVLEFVLLMDSRPDSEKIRYNIGTRCFLTATQYLFAYQYNAIA